MFQGLAHENKYAGVQRVLPHGGLPGQAHRRRHVGGILDYHRILEVFVQVVDIFTHPKRKESDGGNNAVR